MCIAWCRRVAWIKCIQRVMYSVCVECDVYCLVILLVWGICKKNGKRLAVKCDVYCLVKLLVWGICKKKWQKASRWRFRSSDPWVMGPMRFLCANLLIHRRKNNNIKAKR